MALIGWLLLVVVSVLVATVLHWQVRRFWVATVSASLVSPMVVLLASSVLNGGVGAFDGLLFLIALIVSLPVSCLVGAVFDASR